MAVRLDYIGIVAKDLDASRRFYALLGLEFNEDTDHIEAHGEGFRIGIDLESMMREMNPDWKEPIGQRIGLAFQFDSPAEVDTAFAEIIGKGYGGYKAPFDAFWGQRYATVIDPDGNHVDLYAAL